LKRGLAVNGFISIGNFLYHSVWFYSVFAWFLAQKVWLDWKAAVVDVR